MGNAFQDFGAVFQRRGKAMRGPDPEPLIREMKTEILKVREERASVIDSTSQAMLYTGVSDAYKSLAEQIDVCRKRIDEIKCSDWNFEIPL